MASFQLAQPPGERERTIVSLVFSCPLLDSMVVICQRFWSRFIHVFANREGI